MTRHGFLQRPVIVALSMAAVLIAVGCDFPSDPPLKSADDPPAASTYDSTNVLLPLHRGVNWVYLFEQPGRPPSQPRIVTPRPLSYEGVTYHFVPYAAYQMGPGALEVAFPVLLRNDTLGLEFYQPMRAEDTSGISIDPKYIFTLPYPAKVGSYTSPKNPEYSVRLTSRDTLITMANHPVSLPCHRYEIWKGPRLQTVMYVVPGLCILRVEDERRVYHTLAWNI